MGSMQKRALIVLALTSVAIGILATRYHKVTYTPEPPEKYYLHILQYEDGSTEIVFEWMKWGNCPPNGFAIKRNSEGHWDITESPAQGPCQEKANLMLYAFMADLTENIPAESVNGQNELFHVIESLKTP